MKNDKFSDKQRRIYNFLIENPVGVLSTVTSEGKPYGTVIYYKIAKDFVVSFLTKTKTRKYENIKQNNNVMLTVFEPKTQSTSQISGKATEIKDGYEVNKVGDSVLQASLATSDAGIPPLSKLDAGDFVGFNIIPDQINMAVYARPDSGEYSELFEFVESLELYDKIS